jgi:hypothetical protein
MLTALGIAALFTAGALLSSIPFERFLLVVLLLSIGQILLLLGIRGH